MYLICYCVIGLTHPPPPSPLPRSRLTLPLICYYPPGWLSERIINVVFLRFRCGAINSQEEKMFM